MGVLLTCLHCLAMTADKYTIVHKFYSRYHHCCGNFSWLEGYNILFLNQLSLSPSQAANPLQICPQDICGRACHFVFLVCLRTQGKEIWVDESPGTIPTFLPNNSNKLKMWKKRCKHSWRLKFWVTNTEDFFRGYDEYFSIMLSAGFNFKWKRGL